jgi:hypothetical protein
VKISKEKLEECVREELRLLINELNPLHGEDGKFTKKFRENLQQ